MATILVLDDEPSNLEVITAMLARRGHKVLPASAGEEAVRISRTHPGRIDLVITDVILRGRSGATVAQQIAPLRPDVPCLYISGTSKEGLNGLLSDAASSSTQTAFLAKPFTMDQLNAKVEALLAPVEGQTAAEN
jgi:two-component system cell cycle sensor histidine kinase/response regulator CckA